MEGAEALPGQDQDGEQLGVGQRPLGPVQGGQGDRDHRANGDGQPDPARGRAPGHHEPLGVAAEVTGPPVQLGAPGAAGVERLEGGHPLEGVQVLGVQGPVGRGPGRGAGVHPPLRPPGHRRGGECAGQDDGADQRVEHEHIGGDGQGAQRRGDRLGQEPPDQRVEQLHPVDHGRLDAAGAGPLQRPRPELEQLGRQGVPDGLLDRPGHLKGPGVPHGQQPRPGELEGHDAPQLGQHRRRRVAGEDGGQHPGDQDALADMGGRDGQQQPDQPGHAPPCPRRHGQEPRAHPAHSSSSS